MALARHAASRRAHAVPGALLRRRDLPLSRDLLGADAESDAVHRRADACDRAPSAASCCSMPAPAVARPRCWSSASLGLSMRTASASARSSTITFTEKAAAELRERIRMRLREAGDDQTPARATEGAWISTIHAFCARLLRTHALDGRPRPGIHGAGRARVGAAAPGRLRRRARASARRPMPGPS